MSRTKKVSIVFLVGFIVILFSWMFSVDTGPSVAPAQQASNAPTVSAPVADAYSLELVSFKCSTQYGYDKVTGQVKNISDQSIKNIVAVGSFYTDSGEFIKSDEALIAYNPILAGQTSPFEVMTTGNPESAKCKVEFKEMLGGTISTKQAK